MVVSTESTYNLPWALLIQYFLQGSRDGPFIPSLEAEVWTLMPQDVAPEPQP